MRVRAKTLGFHCHTVLSFVLPLTHKPCFSSCEHSHDHVIFDIRRSTIFSGCDYFAQQASSSEPEHPTKNIRERGGRDCDVNLNQRRAVIEKAITRSRPVARNQFIPCLLSAAPTSVIALARIKIRHVCSEGTTMQRGSQCVFRNSDDPGKQRQSTTISKRLDRFPLHTFSPAF